MQTPSADEKLWGRNQFSRLFPSLQESQVHPTPTAPKILEILTIILPLQVGILSPRRTEGEEKQAEETPLSSDRLGIANPELKDLLQMCGKVAFGTLNPLPTWFQKCRGKCLS